MTQLTTDISRSFLALRQTVNGLPLDVICRTVEISLAPHLGAVVPEPLAPVAFRLD